METGALIAPTASHLREAPRLSALQSLVALVSLLMETGALIAPRALSPIHPMLLSASSAQMEPQPLEVQEPFAFQHAQLTPVLLAL